MRRRAEPQEPLAKAKDSVQLIRARTVSGEPSRSQVAWGSVH